MAGGVRAALDPFWVGAPDVGVEEEVTEWRDISSSSIIV